jgi:hypothetical protein
MERVEGIEPSCSFNQSLIASVRRKRQDETVKMSI